MNRFTPVGPLVAALALAGCAKVATGTTTSTTSPTTTSTAVTRITGPTTMQGEATKFLALIAPVNAEERKLIAEHHNGSPSLSELKPLVTPLTTLKRGVLRMGLTGHAATDARRFARAISKEVADIKTDNRSTFTADEAKLAASDNALRSDLGLPTASS